MYWLGKIQSAMSGKYFGFVCVILMIIVQSNSKPDAEPHGCFCKLRGEVDDCSCKVESVDSFNNLQVYPRIKSLLEKDYFRYFKVNLDRGCPFWADDNRCSLRDCHVDQCKEDEVPAGLKGKGHEKVKYTEEAQGDCEKEGNEEEDELGQLDRTISEDREEVFKSWKKHDDAQDLFCELEDENTNEAKYVDLILNPERYTGYKGVSAHRIWNSIYKENCFKPDDRDYIGYTNPKGSQAKTNAEGLMLQDSMMCLEKRAFYRMISGLHTSINVHLSAMHLLPERGPWNTPTWGPNVEEFKKRFDPELTYQEGPQRLKNLYFTYLVELRALAKAEPYLMEEKYYTGNRKEDDDLNKAMRDLLEVIKSFPDHFDESLMFKGDPKIAAELKYEFKEKFRNISKIMDCVGCDKCRLWGKLQVQGMGTALKILFSGDQVGPTSTVNAKRKQNFQLSRAEIVSLFNAFGRLSKSIHEVDIFRKLMEGAT